TGHLMRLLTMPALLTPWLHGLARQRERAVDADRFAAGVLGGKAEAEPPDPLLEKLYARRARQPRAARVQLLQQRVGREAAVHLVLIPRRMVLAKTERAADQL